MMAVYILGGNFSARLMQTVRDLQGLTYGIGSSISGVSFGSDGYWSTCGTFAPEILKKGQKATMDQIEIWFKKGITKDELSAKKTTISVSFKVSIDSTSGLTGKILSYADKKNIGIWVNNRKIGAIGVRVKKWIAYHGFSLNISNDLKKDTVLLLMCV